MVTSVFWTNYTQKIAEIRTQMVVHEIEHHRRLVAAKQIGKNLSVQELTEHGNRMLRLNEQIEVLRKSRKDYYSSPSEMLGLPEDASPKFVSVTGKRVLKDRQYKVDQARHSVSNQEVLMTKELVKSDDVPDFAKLYELHGKLADEEDQLFLEQAAFKTLSEEKPYHQHFWVRWILRIGELGSTMLVRYVRRQ